MEHGHPSFPLPRCPPERMQLQVSPPLAVSRCRLDIADGWLQCRTLRGYLWRAQRPIAAYLLLVAFPMLQEYFGKQQKPGAGLRSMRYFDTRTIGGLVTLVCFFAVFWLLASQSICSELAAQSSVSGVSGCFITSSGGSKNCLGDSSPTRDANPPPASTYPYKQGVKPPAH
ncbi:hypothetical protein B296_00020414 [Ensete ventricosum]|uniref:Uncharacterized protein n=1 Tax=Ensete ventricosum TaxID=4639 RepID=A0A427AJE9_ENSVE|nr:hypothetical protein B296_00020414 [Ensete ventricosum]